ncbi:tetratricopeptide repeat protein [Streptomyces sp. PA03-3a]|nr:tetratricopeptide repeat protein [Streptomyces sp. PA03-3a]
MTTPTPHTPKGVSSSTFNGSAAFVVGDHAKQENHYHAAPTALVVTRTLPRDVAAFTGRQAELDRILAAAGPAQVLAIHTIDGMPGVGKTALATRAAHLLASRFPDGQLFVDLHSHTPGQDPADPSDVLAALLASRGIAPQQIPDGLDERAALWRDHLAGKKVLLVLDDAATHAQIEPLLPAYDGCLVLVTSRRRLVAVDNAVPLPLNTLPPAEAELLFSRLARRNATGADAGAISEAVRLCGYLPLAISLLASRLAHHPAWNIAQFTAAFSDLQDQLSELAAGDRAVAAAFDLSYRDLSDDQQRLFRRLGLHPGSDIDIYAATAINHIPLPQARRHLQALCADHLIDEPAPGRYRFHDLVRAYAQTLAQQDPAKDREHAMERLLNYYQHVAETADQHVTGSAPRQSKRATINERLSLSRKPRDSYTPKLTNSAQSLNWLRTESPNILACVRYAAAQGQHRRVNRLVTAVITFLTREGPWQFAITLQQLAATSARHHGDRHGEAEALRGHGVARRLIDDYPAAVESLQQALTLYRALGDQRGEAETLAELGVIRRLIGDFPAAADLLEQALELHRALGTRIGEAYALAELAAVRRLTGDYPAAADLLEQALTHYRFHGDQEGETHALAELGRMKHLTGDFPAALNLLEQALELHRALGVRHGEAETLANLGVVRRSTGDYRAAADLLAQALELHRTLGDRHGEAETLGKLGVVRRLTGDYRAAADLLEQALELHRTLGKRFGEASTLGNLGVVRRLTGDFPAAADLLEQALELHRALGTRIGEAYALAELAAVRRLTGDFPAAADLLEQALELHRTLGNLPGEAEALNGIGALLAASAQPQESLARYRQALNLARRVGDALEEARALEGIAHCEAQADARGSAFDHLREAISIYHRIGAAEARSAAADLATLEGRGTSDGAGVHGSIDS